MPWLYTAMTQNEFCQSSLIRRFKLDPKIQLIQVNIFFSKINLKLNKSTQHCLVSNLLLNRFQLEHCSDHPWQNVLNISDIGVTLFLLKLEDATINIVVFK